MEGSSVLTDIIIGKFMYHLPFYRLTQQYCESGIGISESTMCGWYEMAVEKRKLLYNLLKQKILSSDYTDTAAADARASRYGSGRRRCR